MKNPMLITILAALTVFSVPQRSQAGDKERAFVAGMIGGAVLTSAVRSDHHRSTYISSRNVSYTAPSCNSRIVIREPSSNYTRYPSRYVRHERVYESEPSGHYEIRQRKVWVPGYQQKYRDSCGRWVVRQVSGYYEIRNERVWVEDRTYVRRSAPSRTRIVYVR
jgi:hypothetical protein